MTDDSSYFSEMRLIQKGFDERAKPANQQVSLWEINEDDGQIKHKKTFKLKGQIVVFQDFLTGQGYKHNNKFLFEGRANEVFWFTTEGEGEQQKVTLSILDHGCDEVTTHEIAADESLAHYVINGSERRTWDLQYGWGMNNNVPTLITDHTG